MGESDVGAVSVFKDALRTFCTNILDRPAFYLLSLVYKLFFNVASADLFSNQTVMRFYGRVQLIIGVFMMFQLAMTILKGIVSPDGMFDGKEGGTASKLVSKIIVALILLSVLVPINVGNPSNEYEEQIAGNGLLFGTLYSLQYRILSNNTIGRLVLGSDSSESSFMSRDTNTLDKSTRIFTSTILKGFYRINLIPEASRKEHDDEHDDAYYNSNRVCKGIDNHIIETYQRLDPDPSDIIDLASEKCDAEDLSLFQKTAGLIAPDLVGSRKYMFAYVPIVPAITAIVFAFILLSFSVDVAVRAVKLAVLRLIAPIPIISYMNPKSGKDGAFQSWVKVLTSTYLDLFIRLATVYFVIFLIQDMIVNGVVINNSKGDIGIFSWIIIWIGLFVFAKQAPKFVRQVLGMKDEGGKLFSGLGAIAGIGAAAGGMIGSGIASARASKLADETRSSFGEKDIFGREIKPNSAGNKAKHLLSGIAGGVAGGFTGAKAVWSAKDHEYKASVDAMRKRNADAISRGNSGSTLLGRMGSSMSHMFTGEGRAAQDERTMQSLESKKKALEAIKSRVSGEMVKQDWTYGTAGGLGKGYLDTSGSDIGDIKFNNKEFVNAMKKADADGTGIVQVVDLNGHTHSIDLKIAGKMSGNILKENEDSYITEVTTAGSGHNDVELMSLINDAEMKGAASDTRYDGTQRTISGYTRRSADHITSRDDYTKVAEAIGQEIRDLSRSNTINKANDNYSGKK